MHNGKKLAVRPKNSVKSSCRWEPPHDGWMRYYMDQSGEARVGAVARDSNGAIVFSAWKFYERCGNAPEAEALACAEGLCWAIQWALS